MSRKNFRPAAVGFASPVPTAKRVAAPRRFFILALNSGQSFCNCSPSSVSCFHAHAGTASQSHACIHAPATLRCQMPSCPQCLPYPRHIVLCNVYYRAEQCDLASRSRRLADCRFISVEVFRPLRSLPCFPASFTVQTKASVLSIMTCNTK